MNISWNRLGSDLLFVFIDDVLVLRRLPQRKQRRLESSQGEEIHRWR